MVFFLIVPSVMIISILLVNGILSRLGLKISYGALALAAVLSLLVDLAAAALSSEPNQDYFFRLFGLIFLAAVVVTALNYFLTKERAEIPTPAQNENVVEITVPAVPNVKKNEAAQLIKTVADKSSVKFFKDKPFAQDSKETLDEILDRADTEKKSGNLSAAVSAYKKALEIYGNDDYAPFVAIDLGNIYKEQAAYTNAIKIYEKALTLPAVKKSAETKKQFQKNLIYLQTVHLVLLKHDALSMPFSKIPKNYLQEIESEFQAAQVDFERKGTN